MLLSFAVWLCQGFDASALCLRFLVVLLPLGLSVRMRRTGKKVKRGVNEVKDTVKDTVKDLGRGVGESVIEVADAVKVGCGVGRRVAEATLTFY